MDVHTDFFAIFIFKLDSLNWQNNSDLIIKISKINMGDSPQADTAKYHYVSFLFIPFFALLLVLFFWRKKYYYVHHLIFTVHFHTFLWIFLSLLFIPKLFFTFNYPGWCATLFFFTPGIYFVFALHQFYSSHTNNLKSWWQTIWKSLTISILYFFLISIISVSLIALYFKVKYPELWNL